MNRRNFLRSVGAVVAGVLVKAGVVDAALAEEEPQEEIYAYRGGLARDTDWLALPGTTKIYLSPTEDDAGWVSYDSGLNWSRCDDISICEPDGEWMDAAEYMANYPVAELAYCSNEVQGVRWSQRYYTDPLEQLYHDFAVASAHAIDREIMSLKGDKE